MSIILLAFKPHHQIRSIFQYCNKNKILLTSFHSNSLAHTSSNAKFGRYSLISKSEEVTKTRKIPIGIDTPSYYKTGQPPDAPLMPEVNNKSSIEGIVKSCNLVKMLFEELSKSLKVGITTDSLDDVAYQFITDCEAYPSPLNYLGFPRSICTSVNNIALHGIPDNRPLSNGDIVSIDVTIFYEGFHGDSCRTFVVGDVDNAGRHLVSSAELCRNEAISICRPGIPFSAIGMKVEEVALNNGVTVVPAVTGHGIGRCFHQPPDIYHCYNDYPGLMEPGHIFTIEPVVCQGSEEIEIWEDGWTGAMVDNGRAAQFEHTILITPDGHKILT